MAGSKYMTSSAKTEQALCNIVRVLETVGGRICDLVRLIWYITDKHEYLTHQCEECEEMVALFGDAFSYSRPAARA